VADQALSQLFAAMRELQLQAGEPSTREIAGAINYSHTTVAQVLAGTKCPKWPTLKAVVGHLDGDLEQFKQLWVAARRSAGMSAEFLDVSETEPDDDTPEGQSRRQRPTVLRLTRTTARDGTQSEALEIFDPRLAQEIIKSYLSKDGDSAGEV
jgi:hypothetical protein